MKFKHCLITFLLLWSNSLQAGDMFAFLGEQATEAQARNYADLIKGDPSQLGQSSAGTAGQTNFDNQTFVYTLTCTSGSITLYALSDDGVTVEIRDLTQGTQWNGLSRLGTGQAMPNLGESFQKCSGTLESGSEYQITIRYRNTLYTGAGDIDGVKLIAIGGTAAFGQIKITKYAFGSWENDGGGSDGFFGFAQASCETAAITGYQLDFNLDGNFDASMATGPTGHGFLFDQPLQPHLGNYGDGTRQVDLRVSTASGLAKTFRLSYPIGNYPPMVSASASVNDATRTVTLSVSATDVGPDTIGSISIDWGDGETLAIPGPAGVVRSSVKTS